MYGSILGQYGLGEVDATWRELLSEPPIGTRIATQDWCFMQPACESLFPDGKCDGLYTPLSDPELEGPEPVWAGADVVCIRSAPNDRCGRHNCVKVPDTSSGARAFTPFYLLPPGAIVTLVSVQDTWRVRRNTMKCRLFTCDVWYDVW